MKKQAKKKQAKKKLKKAPTRPPEVLLREYWRGKLKANKCDGDTLFADVRAGITDDLARSEFVVDIRERIFLGKPLSFAQYHVAIAMRYLITELSYETFFKTRWHETDHHMAYGSGGRVCDSCVHEKKEKK